MSFPFDVPTTEKNKTVIIPREYGVNFETGELTGEIVEENEAIKVWIYFALNTPRYRYLIYSWDYGNELEDLVGQSYPQEFLNTEVQSLVEDCLFVNENITGLSDFEVECINDKLKISFTANTIYGEVDIDV